MAFYGHRNRWSSYFLAGFFALALICISIILKVGVEPAINPPSKAIRGLFLVAALVAGVVGGIISIVFWRGAGLLACGLGGFFFGLFLQAVRPGGLIRPVGLRFILYAGFYAVFFTISCVERVHTLTLALSTAIIGATAVTLGIDCFSTQGLKEFYVRNLGFDSLFSNKYPPTFQNGNFPLVEGMQIELGVFGALVLMGFAFQMRLWSDLRAQLAVLKRSDGKRNMRSKAERAARAVARTAKRDLQEWEARHGYTKTASRNLASQDEERKQKPHELVHDSLQS
uniref:TM7S3/TM198-like domain-containing protein n=1 Tax=Kalmanozyma brasiliensis (strain GHG001) TaxID=1365824 RepID=V5EW90_KALBG